VVALPQQVACGEAGTVTEKQEFLGEPRRAGGDYYWSIAYMGGGMSATGVQAAAGARRMIIEFGNAPSLVSCMLLVAGGEHTAGSWAHAGDG
jgi:hypothetical protein